MSTITESYAVDQQADIFVAKFARRISPVAAYVGALYGDQKLRLDQVARVLAVVTHAVEFGEFDTTFIHRRAALSALDVAERYIKDPGRFDGVDAGDARAYIAEFVKHAQTLTYVLGEIIMIDLDISS